MTLSVAPLAPHLAALGLFGLDVAVRGLRLQLLLPGAPRPSLWRAIAVNAYGETGAAVTPGRLGGDPARFVGLRRAGVATPGALAALGAERLIGWVLLGTVAVLLSAAFAGSGAHAVRRLLHLATTRQAVVAIVAVLVVAAASVALVRRYRHRVPPQATLSLAETWRRARLLGWKAVAGATALTAVSMAARVAILPVLVAGHPGLDHGAVVLGSFALLYGQLFLPTPGGAGGVELGFVGGFAGTMSAGQLAALLVAWRTYTLILGATLGGILLARGGLGRLWTRPPYSPTSSLKVRSQL